MVSSNFLLWTDVANDWEPQIHRITIIYHFFQQYLPFSQVLVSVMAIYRWVLQLSNRNCRVFVRHLVFLPTFVILPFELTRTNYCSAQISALEEDCIKMNKMIISLSPLSPLLWWCQSLMIPLLHMKDKIQPGANKVWSVDMSDMAPGGISNYLRFEPNNENTQFFLYLISLYNNRNQWQLQRSIFEKNHTFYWTPGAAYYLFPDTTMFIHYS